MVKSRRPLPPTPSSSESPSLLSSSSSPSPAASSLSLISHPPRMKPSSSIPTPFISSLKRCPLLGIHADLSPLSINPPGETAHPYLQQLHEVPNDDHGSRTGEDAVMMGGEEGLERPAGCGRARLQQHWIQVGGKVMIPDTWGLEQHLQEWVSFGLVEDAFRPAGLLSARSALVADCQRRPPRASSSQPTKGADPVEVSSCG